MAEIDWIGVATVIGVFLTAIGIYLGHLTGFGLKKHMRQLHGESRAQMYLHGFVWKKGLTKEECEKLGGFMRMYQDSVILRKIGKIS
jgi:hypothetical protein